MKSVKDKRGAVPATETVEHPFSSFSFPSAIPTSQWASTSRHTRGEAGEAKTDGLLFQSSSMFTLPTSATDTTCSVGTPLRSCASGNSSIGYWPLSMHLSERDSVCVGRRGEDETRSSAISCFSSTPMMWSGNEANVESVQEENEGWDDGEEEPKRKKKGKKKVKKIAKRSCGEKKEGGLHRIRDACSAVPCWDRGRIHDDGVGLASYASSSSASDPVWWRCKKLRKKILWDHPMRVEPHASLSTDSCLPPFGSVSSSPSSTPYVCPAVERKATVVSKPHAASSGSRAHTRIAPPRGGGGGGGGHPQSSFSATVEALAARAQRASSYFDPVLPEPSSLPFLDTAAAAGKRERGGDERDASYYISELHRQVAEMRAADEEDDEEEEETCSSDASSSSDDLRMEEEEEDEWDAVHSTERMRREKRRLAHPTKEKLLKREREGLQAGKKKRMAPFVRPLISSTLSAPAVASSSTASSLKMPFFSRAHDGGEEEKRGGSEVSVEFWAGSDSRVKSDRWKRNRKGEPHRKRGVKKKRHAGGGNVAGDSFVFLQDLEPWEETLEWEEDAEEGEYSFPTSPCNEYMDESDYYLSSFDGGSSGSEDGSRSRSSNTNHYNSSGEDEDEDGDRVCVVMEYSLEDMERMEESSLTKKRRKKKDKKIIKEKIRKDALHRKVRPQKYRRMEREQPPSFVLAPLSSPSALPPPFSLPPTRSKLCQQEKSLEQLFDCTTAH